jgi:hypothetical protein
MKCPNEMRTKTGWELIIVDWILTGKPRAKTLINSHQNLNRLKVDESRELVVKRQRVPNLLNWHPICRKKKHIFHHSLTWTVFIAFHDFHRRQAGTWLEQDPVCVILAPSHVTEHAWPITKWLVTAVDWKYFRNMIVRKHMPSRWIKIEREKFYSTWTEIGVTNYLLSRYPGFQSLQ